MDENTRKMVVGWVRDGGLERAARFLAKVIDCPIRTARELVRDAYEGR